MDLYSERLSERARCLSRPRARQLSRWALQVELTALGLPGLHFGINSREARTVLGDLMKCAPGYWDEVFPAALAAGRSSASLADELRQLALLAQEFDSASETRLRVLAFISLMCLTSLVVLALNSWFLAISDSDPFVQVSQSLVYGLLLIAGYCATRRFETVLPARYFWPSLWCRWRRCQQLRSHMSLRLSQGQSLDSALAGGLECVADRLMAERVCMGSGWARLKAKQKLSIEAVLDGLNQDRETEAMLSLWHSWTHRVFGVYLLALGFWGLLLTLSRFEWPWPWWTALL
jgi:hypothetical protein